MEGDLIRSAVPTTTRPEAPVFLVVTADTTDTHLTLHGQPPGLHKFKVTGSNSRGEGPESVVVEATVAQAATG